MRGNPVKGLELGSAIDDSAVLFLKRIDKAKPVTLEAVT
jgi:hypothetical protein